MASGVTNWTKEKDRNPAGDRRVLDKAKRIEEEKLSNGWRYIRIGTRTEVLVPCDSNGKPTKMGLKMIQEIKDVQGIK